MNMKPTQLAREIRRDPNYVRDFLNRRKDSLGAGEILEIERALGLVKGHMLGVSDARGVPPEDLQEGRCFATDTSNIRRIFNSPSESNEAMTAAVKRGQLQPGEVPERNVIAGLGHGGQADEVMVDGEVLDGVRAIWRLPVEYLRTELRAREPEVDILAVDGDSMLPTLAPGDRVLVNRSQSAPSPDGLYAIFDGIGVSIKRLELVAGSKPLRVKIISDNPHHSTHEIQAEDLHVIGRVIMKMSRL